MKTESHIVQIQSILLEQHIVNKLTINYFNIEIQKMPIRVY